MTEETTETTNPNTLTFTVPGIDGENTLDLATLPAEVRLDLLKTAAKLYITNRVNATVQRHKKDASNAAWDAYEAATAADPLQSVVAKPTTERTPSPDLRPVMQAAIDDLIAGKMRKMGGEPKARERADPLTALVTKSVVDEVYQSKKAADPKYTFIMARAEVGKDGIAYLNTLIEAKVAAGVDRASLEKMRDERYIKPAKLMLGIDQSKGMKELPSLL